MDFLPHIFCVLYDFPMTKKDTDWQRTTFASSTSGISNMEHGIWVKDKFITNDQLAQIVKLQLYTGYLPNSPQHYSYIPLVGDR